ncbi:MAG: GH92 family glycosyl hydrolase [Bacteroidaceae bacterium]|nr:GH92 family glycosyl hydrolase [Bacteroidaceae bacterium]MBR6805543.1 GH92 family glycosyl hydrolase [Bacteroidaceae bacterium]
MKKNLLMIGAILLAICTQAQEPVDYVDPFIGTTNFGTTNPGAICPSGMMSVVPFNVMGSDINEQDKDSRWWSAPYEYCNKYFTGYAHVALSGVGCPEASSLLVMPTTGELNVDYHSYGSEYTDEVATPGYFANSLSKYGIRTEVTATTRSSCERYTFPAGKGHILLNLGEGLTNESGAMVRRVSATEIEGVKLLGTFCYNPGAVFPIYFVMRVDKTPTKSGYWKKQPLFKGVEAEWTVDDGEYKLYTNYNREISGDDIGFWFTYDNLKQDEQITVRIGVSFVSTENARKNLDKEQQGQSFDELRANARNSWNKDLGRIKVSGGTDVQKKIFYTALYHALIHPSILSDVNGEYPAMESGLTTKSDYTRYTIFSLWDTYRNLHQLLTLVYPERQTDMLRSMVDMYNEWGWLPRWELFGRETYTMEGDPAAIVIADSYVKGLRDFDYQTAYKAMLKSATTPGKENPIRPDIDPYIEKGYIPLGYFANDLSGDNSVSHALEYCLADYAIAQMADSLGKKKDAKEFLKRSQSYRRYFCKEYGTLRPITEEGKFLEDFDATTGKNFENIPGFHEGSAWSYTFAVPHDVNGLARLMGGKKAYIKSLQYVFDEEHYDPANEPDIVYPYLFSRFKGEEWRTQREVKTLLDSCFRAAPNGIPGNDDTGTMSAWAVFSMMGLYPDTPSEPYYTLTTPTFDRVEIETINGTVVIEATRPDDNCHYIESMTLGDKPLKKYRITHSELLDKRHLTFKLKAQPK